MFDNSASQKLLEWINHQWNQIGGTTTIYNFSQLQKSSLLYQLLQKVHPTYFQSLNHLSLQFDPYFSTIQSFLLQIEGKRIRRPFKRQIIEEHSTSQIIKLILWLLLQSQHKNQFINRIFELHVETQTSLMVDLKTVDDALENYIEIKDILTTVETLQEENEELRDKLKSYSDATKQLQQTVQQIKLQNKKMQKQVVKYEAEKHNVLEELQLNDLKQYMQIYRTVKRENEQLSKTINESQQRRSQVQSQNTLLKQKINQDCDIICSLQDQVQKARYNFEQAKDQVSILTNSYRNSFEDSVLRQNKNINNTKMRQSMETTCSIGYSKILWELEEDGESQKLRNFNEEMMQKLQNAYKAISQLTGEVGRLKQEKKKVEKKNENLERKVKEIKTQHSRFVKELRNCGF